MRIILYMYINETKLVMIYVLLLLIFTHDIKVISYVSTHHGFLHDGTALLGKFSKTPPSPEPGPPLPLSSVEAVGFKRRAGSLATFMLTCINTLHIHQ